jgi:hypothetical protein
MAAADPGVEEVVLRERQPTSGTISGTSISYSYASATETLTLTGYDTEADYQTALTYVQYFTTGGNPTNYGINAARTIQWTLSDGAPNIPFGEQNSGSTFISIDAVNDAPTNTAPATRTVNEDTALAFTGGNTISVADPDNQSLTVTLSAGQGAVTLGSTTNLTVSGTNGGASVTIAGLIADLNNALATLSYQGNANFHGSDTVTVSTTDGVVGLPTVSTVNITVNSVDDAPTGASNTVSTAQNTPYVFQTSDFGFSDPNDGPPFGTANTFQAVKIGSPPLAGAGTLFFDSDGNGANPPVAVTPNQLVQVSDIAAGHLYFTPANGAAGINEASFTFQVEDSGSATPPNANLDPTAKTMTINVGVSDTTTFAVTGLTNGHAVEGHHRRVVHRGDVHRLGDAVGLRAARAGIAAVVEGFRNRAIDGPRIVGRALVAERDQEFIDLRPCCRRGQAADRDGLRTVAGDRADGGYAIHQRPAADAEWRGAE